MNKKTKINTEVNKGNVLVAQAFMNDTHFERTVLMMTEHNHEGSVGFIVNKPIVPSMDDLLEGFGPFDGQVYYGGPVATDTVHYLHNVPLLLPESYHVVDDLFWGGDFEKVKSLVKEDVLSRSNIRFFIGYSGWSKGQLEGELKSGSWLVSSIPTDVIFKDQNEAFWKEVMYDLGDNFAVISQMSNKNKLN